MQDFYLVSIVMCLAFCSDSKWILFLKTLLLTGEINFSMSSGGRFSGVQAEGAKARTGERKRVAEKEKDFIGYEA